LIGSNLSILYIVVFLYILVSDGNQKPFFLSCSLKTQWDVIFKSKQKSSISVRTRAVLLKTSECRETLHTFSVFRYSQSRSFTSTAVKSYWRCIPTQTVAKLSSYPAHNPKPLHPKPTLSLVQGHTVMEEVLYRTETETYATAVEIYIFLEMFLFTFVAE